MPQKYSFEMMTTDSAAAVAFFTAYLVLKIKTDRNHDNLTNEELDWKYQLGKQYLIFFLANFVFWIWIWVDPDVQVFGFPVHSNEIYHPNNQY